MPVKRIFVFLLLCLFCRGAIAQQVTEQQPPVKTRILVILDCSASMWGTWTSDSKIKITQTVLNRFLDSIQNIPNTEIALRVFGHLNKNAYGTRLEVPFEKGNIIKIRNKIKTLVPKGNCTVASALSSAENDFPSCASCRNLVIIITDGVDDCEGDICSVSMDIQKSGTIVQTFIIGIGTKEDIRYNYNCAGPFFSVKNEDMFTTTLYGLEKLSMSLAPLQVKLLDSYGNPSETNVPIIFYDNKSNVAKYRYMHTLHQTAVPDTFLIDPLLTYNMEVGTLPALFVKDLSFQPFQLNTVEVKAAQGDLSVSVKKVKTTLPEMNAKVLVKESGSGNILNIQSLTEKQTYLTGKYDLEVLCLPRMKLENVEIAQSSLTNIEIPFHGLANINKGKAITVGDLYMENGKELERVCSFDESKTTESLYLQPGRYVAILREKNKNNTTDSMVKEFTIESGQITNVNF